MPRSKSELPGGIRMSDLLTLGMLCEHVPSADVQAAVLEAGSSSKRDRLLPAELVTLYVVALNLYREVSYEEVLRCVTEGWRWLGLGQIEIASKGAITQARERLGKDALRLLFERLAKPVATSRTKGSHYRSWLTVAIDGTTLKVPDSSANALAFGYAGSKEQASFPLVQCVSLCETGTHVPFAAAMGPYASSEHELARKVLGKLKPGMLLLADRGFLGFELWEELLVTGAQLLIRASKSWSLGKKTVLEDGSWLSEIRSHSGTGGKRIVRVIQYTVKGSDETYRLVTSILDPKEAPALELAGLYTERWEIEGVFDEMKTHLKGARAILRSKTPELVEQEFWGLMIAYRAIRTLMHEAALAHNKDPDEISFVSAVRIVKRTLPSREAFSPSAKNSQKMEETDP